VTRLPAQGTVTHRQEDHVFLWLVHIKRLPKCSSILKIYIYSLNNPKEYIALYYQSQLFDFILQF